MSRLLLFIALSVLLLLLPAQSWAVAIVKDTVWSGEVAVNEDIVVPEGITLTILPGTAIRVARSDSTKTEPEYLSPLTEITVRGKLVVAGGVTSPVTFSGSAGMPSVWSGIIVDGGIVDLQAAQISNAEAGVEILRGAASLRGCRLKGNRYGLVVHGGMTGTVAMKDTRIEGNDYGAALLNGASIEDVDSLITGNKKKDTLTASAKTYPDHIREFKTVPPETRRIYGDGVLLGITVWKERIEVNGIVRVPENSRLIILPGTLIEFGNKDTNNDGIGESGLLIQGVIIAKGTRENPIIFRSAGTQGKMGSWDSINIMNSDRAQNLIEYCQIEDAYRGLHFHFSNVAVADSVLRNNYRGIQFQESIVEIVKTHFYGNKSGLQARDSEIILRDNVILRNYSGMNVLRSTLAATGNSIIRNHQDGMRIREGIPVAEENLIAGNRQGLMIHDTLYGTFGRNVISHNLENGLALKGAENIEIIENAVQGNGLNGISILDTNAYIHGNLISGNGERGIGIQSFQGRISGNNILRNGLYNIGIDGATDVVAERNWWGGEDLKKTIFDKDDDPLKGRALYQPELEMPVQFAWPLKAVATDASWHGAVVVRHSIVVEAGSALSVYPGTSVLFAKGAGLNVKGKILAKGETKAGITFTAQGSGDAWGEVFLDHAEGSAFSNCTFERATWGLHVHFTNLSVQGCTFTKNHGGMRFASGPIEIRDSSFRDNTIGLRSYGGVAFIAGNTISGNDVGIFVREKGSGLTITGNNIFENSGYNIRIGDFNNENVNARLNWWGPGSPADKILDERIEPGIGRVWYEPYLTEPVRLIGKEGS